MTINNQQLTMNKSKAFTLIEMLVAITIFSLIVGSTLGLSVAAIRSQVKALALQKLLDETSYVMEYMGRMLRMAKKELSSSPPPSCISVGSNYSINPFAQDYWIMFRNYQDQCMQFYTAQPGGFSRDTILRQNIPVADIPLTSSDLEVTSLVFNLSGQTQTDNLQPRVTIVMTIKKAGVGGPEIKIQTTISQRNLDVQQ